MKRIYLLTFVVALLVGVSQTHAEPGSGGLHPPGAGKLIVDAPPDDPGLSVENYFLNYNDTNGIPSHGLVPRANPASNLDAEIDGEAGVLPGNYTVKPERFGGYHAIAASVFYLWPDVKDKAAITTPGGPVSHRKSVYNFGLSDVEYWPVMLGRIQNHFRYDVRLSIYSPSGQSAVGQPGTVGQGYSTLVPEVGFSW